MQPLSRAALYLFYTILSVPWFWLINLKGGLEMNPVNIEKLTMNTIQNHLFTPSVAGSAPMMHNCAKRTHSFLVLWPWKNHATTLFLNFLLHKRNTTSPILIVKGRMKWDKVYRVFCKTRSGNYMVFICSCLHLSMGISLCILTAIPSSSLESVQEHPRKNIMIRFIKCSFAGCLSDLRQVSTWHSFLFSQQQQFQYPHHTSARGYFFVSVLVARFPNVWASPVAFLRC